MNRRTEIWRYCERLKGKIRDHDLYENALYSFQHRKSLFLCLARYREFFLRLFDNGTIGDSNGAGRISLLARNLEESLREYEDKFHVYDFSQVKDFVVQNRSS